MIPAITSLYELGNSTATSHLHHHHMTASATTTFLSETLSTMGNTSNSSAGTSSNKLSSSGGINSTSLSLSSSTTVLSTTQPIEIPNINQFLDINKDYHICNTNFNKKSAEFNRSLNSSPTLLSIFNQLNNSNGSSTAATPQSPISPLSTSPFQQTTIYNSLSSIYEEQISNQQQQSNFELNNSSNNIINNNNINNSCESISTQPEEQQQQTPSSIQSQRKRSISMSIPDLNLLSHQVAGQAPLFKLPDGKILKPLVATEYQFYKSLDSHTEFLDFTPKFYGIIDLKCVDHDYLEKSCKSNSQSSSIFDYNHWRNKIVKLPKEKQNLYIKLEDLTYLCKYPCILDLKMGVRQHGNDAPKEKVFNMESKCKATTSSSLGFRVCGLKIFDQRTSQYQTFDKYYGRNLKPSDIPMVICKFLDNGIRFRVELLTAIAKRLTQLVSLFEQQQCYKFYGGSLLFIYDGQSNNMQNSKLNIKMVDFAHASPNTNQNNNNNNTDNNNNNENNMDLDEGYLFGLKNLLKIINTLIQLSNSTNNQNTI